MNLLSTISSYHLTRKELNAGSIVLYREENEYDDIVIKSHKYFKQYPISLKAYRKVPGGIRYLKKHYPDFSLAICYHDIASEGLFSVRPYRLGQPDDASTYFMVLALFYDFCVKQKYNPIALLEHACQENEGTYCLQELKDIASFAKWQGVVYPELWTQTEIDSLIKSLEAIALGSLADVVNYMLPEPLLEENQYGY